MPRLIPGKTKVHIELFRGVTLRDILVGIVAMLMLIFVILSNLPGKLWICLGLVMVTIFLLVRLDEQPNYIYCLHILSYLGYNRHFARVQRDAQLKGKNKGDMAKAAKEIQEEDRQNAAAKTKVSKREQKSQEKARKEQLARDEKLLKAKDTPPEVLEEIRSRRARQSREAQIREAETKDRSTSRKPMEEIISFTGIKDGFIEYLGGQYYGAVLEIDPVEFRFFSEHRRANSIERCLGRILRGIHAGYSANIVKLERPIMYDSYLQREYEKVWDLKRTYENGVLSEEELKARVEIEYDRVYELQAYCGDAKVTTAFYYLVLFESDKRQLDLEIREAEQLLRNGEMNLRRLDDKGLAVFLKYSNQIDFDEREVETIDPADYAKWAQPEQVDIRVRRVEVNHVITHNFRVVNYPSIVGDAWLAGVMSLPGTKVVVKCQPMDRNKAIRSIDHSLVELRGQWSNTGVDSRRMEIESHISSLQELLSTLQSDSETLLEVGIYITAYDIAATRANLRIPQPPESILPQVNDMKKHVRRTWQESGFRLNNMEFDQVQAFIGAQISAMDPMLKESRGISSNTVAACFPWIFAHISDEGGVKLGESDGLPVFIDFFRRDSERVNSNMVIVGKSGSGKSYATKSLLANLAAEDAKIFILDPENEYTELAANLHGKIINVGNAQYGRLNPFHIITALEDDEAGAEGPSGSYSTHLQFLEEFFKQIMPDCEKDAMEYLNTLMDRVYLTHNITPETDLSKLSPRDYPIFDDLYDEVLREFQSSDNPFTRDLLRSLMNYIAKFSTGGRNANIWNGPSTVTTDENFTVFNFQSMLANRNSTIANAQMLLVLKYLDNEIIKNRDYNLKYRTNRKIVVVIDEAHVFIDAKYPIALDFMFQLAKRIRKYNGMQIVITQNIKDFVGSEELARKSTAIINACQYSFIFALAPNDMKDLVSLYEKAGGINENEQEQIMQAPRGQAFTILSPTSRSTFQVETSSGISELFESRDHRNVYFSGPEGETAWEDFVAESRPAHDQAIASRGRRLEDGLELPSERTQSGVSFREFEQEEYESQYETPARQEGQMDEDDFPQIPDDDVLDSQIRDRRAAMTGSLGTMGSETGPMTEMIGLFASAVDKMSAAIDNLGSDRGTATSSVVQIPALQQNAGTESSDAIRTLEARLLAQEEELRRLHQENEKLRSGKLGAQKEEASAAILPTDMEAEEPKDAETSTEALADAVFQFPESKQGTEQGEEPKEESLDYLDTQQEEDFLGLLDDESEVSDQELEQESEGILNGDSYSPESDDVLLELLTEDDDEDDFFFRDDEDNDLALGDGSDADIESEGEKEDEDLLFGDDGDDYDIEEDEADSEDDEDDEDDEDILSSFYSFANQLKAMTVFEKMRFDGVTVETITVDALETLVQAQKEKRRQERLNGLGGDY